MFFFKSILRKAHWYNHFCLTRGFAFAIWSQFSTCALPWEQALCREPSALAPHLSPLPTPLLVPSQGTISAPGNTECAVPTLMKQTHSSLTAAQKVLSNKVTTS